MFNINIFLLSMIISAECIVFAGVAVKPRFTGLRSRSLAYEPPLRENQGNQ